MTAKKASSLAAAYGRGWQSPRRAPDIIEQVLVKVNGEIITKTDLEDARSPRSVRKIRTCGPIATPR